MNEHDIVQIKRKVNNVPKNSSGTIIHIYNETAFVVEFIINGINYIETISKTNIK